MWKKCNGSMRQVVLAVKSGDGEFWLWMKLMIPAPHWNFVSTNFAPLTPLLTLQLQVENSGCRVSCYFSNSLNFLFLSCAQQIETKEGRASQWCYLLRGWKCFRYDLTASFNKAGDPKAPTDAWNCYPWDASAYDHSIDEHEEIGRNCGGESGTTVHQRTNLAEMMIWLTAGIIMGTFLASRK